MPAAPALVIKFLSIGTSASPPSSEKRLAPGNLDPRYFSMPSAAVKPLRRVSFSSLENSGFACTDSIFCCNQRFWSVSVMCMYSAPIEPQYVLLSDLNNSPNDIESLPMAKDPTLNTLSKSLSERLW